MRHEIEESLCAEKKRQNNARERDRIQSINESFRVLQRAVRPFSDDQSCGVPKVNCLNLWRVLTLILDKSSNFANNTRSNRGT